MNEDRNQTVFVSVPNALYGKMIMECKYSEDNSQAKLSCVMISFEV